MSDQPASSDKRTHAKHFFFILREIWKKKLEVPSGKLYIGPLTCQDQTQINVYFENLNFAQNWRKIINITINEVIWSFQPDIVLDHYIIGFLHVFNDSEIDKDSRPI